MSKQPTQNPADLPFGGRRVLGVPGGSVAGGQQWAKTDANALRLAAKAERDTADVLNGHTNDGAVILHDLKVPAVKGNANIDHVVVSGNRVHLVDAKAWKPGFIWSMGGTSRRGLRRFAPASSTSMQYAKTQVEALLLAKGLRGVSVDATVVVWPTSAGSLSLWALTMPGARVIRADQLGSWARRNTRGRNAAANPEVVRALAAWLITAPRPTGFVAGGI